MYDKFIAVVQPAVAYPFTVRRQNDQGEKLPHPYLTTKTGTSRTEDVDVYPGSLDTQHLKMQNVTNWPFHKDNFMFEGSDVSKEKVKYVRVDMKIVKDAEGLTDEENTKAGMCVFPIPYRTVYKQDDTDHGTHPYRA